MKIKQEVLKELKTFRPLCKNTAHDIFEIQVAKTTIDLTLAKVKEVIDNGCNKRFLTYSPTKIYAKCGDIGGGEVLLCERCEELKKELNK